MKTKPVPCPDCGKRLKCHKKRVGIYKLFVCTHGCKGANGKCLEIFVLDSGKDYKCQWFELCARLWLLNYGECKEI